MNIEDNAREYVTRMTGLYQEYLDHCAAENRTPLPRWKFQEHIERDAIGEMEVTMNAKRVWMDLYPERNV